MDPVAEIIKYPVPADQWQDYVDAFSASSGIKPDPSVPPLAVFKISDTLSVHVIEENQAQLKPDTPAYAGVSSEQEVEIFVKYFKFKRSDIQVVSIKNGALDTYTINMATTKIPKKGTTSSDEPTQDTSGSTSTTSGLPDLDETNALEGGVIHNPPGAALAQTSNSASTDE